MKVKTVYFLILSIYFLSAVVYMINATSSFQRPLLVISLATVILVMVATKKKFQVNQILISVFFLFALSFTISSAKNSDIELLIGGFLLLSLYIVFTVFVSEWASDSDRSRIVAKTILWTHIPFIGLSLLMDGLNTVPMSGPFYTGNAFGSIVSTVFAVIFSSFLYRLDRYVFDGKKVYGKIVAYLPLLALLLYMTILSGSRNSTLATLFVLSAGMVIFILKLIYYRKLFNKKTFTLGIIALSTVPLFSS